jgi:hypothetical protein
MLYRLSAHYLLKDHIKFKVYFLWFSKLELVNLLAILEV